MGGQLSKTTMSSNQKSYLRMGIKIRAHSCQTGLKIRILLRLFPPVYQRRNKNQKRSNN